MTLILVLSSLQTQFEDEERGTCAHTLNVSKTYLILVKKCVQSRTEQENKDIVEYRKSRLNGGKSGFAKICKDQTRKMVSHPFRTYMAVADLWK